jgi:hypothetical protein
VENRQVSSLNLFSSAGLGTNPLKIIIISREAIPIRESECKECSQDSKEFSKEDKVYRATKGYKETPSLFSPIKQRRRQVVLAALVAMVLSRLQKMCRQAEIPITNKD